MESHGPTTTLLHHSLLIVPYRLVCCFCAISNTTIPKELHFEGMTNLNSCYNIHSMFYEEVCHVRAHTYGAQPATLNMHAIHKMLSRANIKHICPSFASRADGLLVQYLRCPFRPKNSSGSKGLNLWFNLEDGSP